MRRAQHLTHPRRTATTIDRTTRFAAVVATAVALPVVLAVAFLVGDGGDGNSSDDSSATASPSATATGTPGPLRTSVPAPAADARQTCAPVLAALPQTLEGGDGVPTVSRLTVTPGGPTFLAWGEPLVTVQCGVERPARLRSDVAYDPIVVGPTADPGATWLVDTVGDHDVWTTVDRAVYVRMVIPNGDVGYLVQVSQVIAAQLPAVCKTSPETGDPDDTVYCGSRP